MSQHDLTIANDTRTNVRTDIQNAVQALGSNSKGPSAPGTPYAGQFWLDDDIGVSNTWALKQYDGTDWNEIYRINVSTGAVTFSGVGSGVPAGAIMDFAGSAAPTGWLLCYGQAESRTTYADLFMAIGTTYGAGDGSTTFNLPDCRGRVAAGKDNMGGVSADRLTNQTGGLNGDTLGATGGAETHTLTTAQMPAHTHTAGYGEIDVGGLANPNNVDAGATWGVQPNPATSSTGGGGAHNNVQPTIVFNKIIKT